MDAKLSILGFMSAKLLKQVMDANDKTVINVASDTGLAPNTVARYLSGEAVHRSTVKLLEGWAREHSKVSGKAG